MCDIAIRRNSTGGSTGDRTVIISSVSSTLQLEEWAILSATAASGLNKKCSCPYRTTTATPRPTVSPPMLMFRLLSAVRRIVGQMYKGRVFDPSLFAIVTYYSNPKLAGPAKAVVDCTQHNKQDYAAQYGFQYLDEVQFDAKKAIPFLPYMKGPATGHVFENCNFSFNSRKNIPTIFSGICGWMPTP